jgi:hypothetical protein
MAAGTIGTRATVVVEADLPLLEPAHHAGGGIEAEGAAARQHDGVHAIDEC